MTQNFDPADVMRRLEHLEATIADWRNRLGALLQEAGVGASQERGSMATQEEINALTDKPIPVEHITQVKADLAGKYTAPPHPEPVAADKPSPMAAFLAQKAQ